LVEPRDLGFDAKAEGVRTADPEVKTLKEAKDSLERTMVMSVLDRHKGNIARSAEELGISRPTLYDIMKKHGLFSETLQQEGAAPDNR
jgi:two-component system NtrC family response regulator